MEESKQYPQPKDFKEDDEINWASYYEALELVELEDQGLR